jgi:hypothetical protein
MTRVEQGAVFATDVTADGSVWFGGSFQVADGVVVGPAARLAASCPAAVVEYGASCLGAVGPIRATVATTPWVGAPFDTTVENVAPGALTFAAYGLQQIAVPFASLVPQGLPGCLSLVEPIVLQFVVPTSGTASARLLVPSSGELTGVEISHQFLVLEVSPSGALTAVGGSQGIGFTPGSYGQ